MLKFAGETVWTDCSVVTGEISPGAAGVAVLQPISPEYVRQIAVPGTAFVMHEGPRQIGHGVVLEVHDCATESQSDRP